MDAVPVVIFTAAFAAFIGCAIYTFVAGSYLFYDYIGFKPADRIGFKRVPRQVRIAGYTSIAVFCACVFTGFIMAAATN